MSTSVGRPICKQGRVSVGCRGRCGEAGGGGEESAEGRRCVVEPADVLNPRPVGGQIAWASSVNAAAIRRAGGASSPSS
jgi:hypothetical protein